LRSSAECACPNVGMVAQPGSTKASGLLIDHVRVMSTTVRWCQVVRKAIFGIGRDRSLLRPYVVVREPPSVDSVGGVGRYSVRVTVVG
jgi:hypothetical protein